MLVIDRLVGNVKRVANGQSIADFVAWFRTEADDVHLEGNDVLIELVESIESLLSDYYFAGLGAHGLREGLANAILPFDRNVEKFSVGRALYCTASASPVWKMVVAV